MFFFLLLVASALQRGLEAMQQGQYAEAKAALQEAAKANPKDAVAWVSLAETCRRLNDETEAGEAARRAAEEGGSNAMVAHALAAFYSEEGHFLEAAQWEEKYADSPKADSAAMARASELYSRGGSAADSARMLTKAWRTHPADPQLSFERAKLLLEKLDFAGAADTVAQARKAHPNDPQLILVSGVANYGERRFPEAIDNFLAVIAVDHSIPQPYQFLGKMLEHAGARLPELTAAFEKRVQQAPQDPLPYLVLAKAKLAANSKDANAEELLQRSLALEANQWEAHYELGVLLENKHDYKRAAEELSRAAELSPKQAMPHYHLGRVYDRLGDPEQAQAERKLHEELTSQPPK